MSRQRPALSPRRRSSTKESADDATERKPPAKIPSRRNAQEPLQQRPTSAPRSTLPGTSRVLPMQLQIGDRIADEAREWEVTGRAFTTVGGKNANVRVRLIKQPTVTEIRVWGAQERISVKRARAEEGKR
jgi:hypothetical protein